MESRPLNAPHPLLERAVAVLIPSAARETMLGDLFELYRSPGHYFWAALRTMPFVVASQIRRQANIPVLMMQGLMVAASFNGLILSLRLPLNPASVVFITLAAMAAMLLFEAYRSEKQTSEKRAILEAIIVAIAVLAYAYHVLIVLLHANRAYAHFNSWSLFFWLILPLGTPTLCALRAGLIVGREASDQWTGDDMSRDDLVHRYQSFESQARGRNRLEIALLILTGALSVFALWRMRLTLGLPGSLLAATYAVTPTYLLIHGAPRALPARGDFLSLRDAFRQEMERQYQLRAFVGWLGPAPLLFLLYAVAFRHSAGPTQQLWLVYATMATMSGGFLVLARNRDRGARLRSVTNHLDRLRERPAR